MNKIDAQVDLVYKSPDQEDISLGICVNELSGQMSVLLDGMYFAHIHVGDNLKVSISFQELIGKVPAGGKVLEIDLRELLE